MPEFKFRSKKYKGTTWRLIQKDVYRDLRREELMAFAPKARVAQGDTPVPPSPQTPSSASFPFMKLPLELRAMVFKMHFAQAREITYFPPLMRVLDGPGKFTVRRRSFWTSNEGVPVRLLWTLSKDLYHEAMPLYFQITKFTFNSLESLAQFLKVIGPYHRQYVTSVHLNSSRFDSSMDRENPFLDSKTYAGSQALKLLRKCPALRYMQFNLPPVQYHLAETSEWFRAILKIRELKTVDFGPVPLDSYNYWAPFDPSDEKIWEFHEHNKQVLQVLKQPHRPAAIKKREARGISRVAVPRTFFGSVTRSEVRDWFDARESEAVTESSQDAALGHTELEHLKRERKLVEASLDYFEDDQYQDLKPL